LQGSLDFRCRCIAVPDKNPVTQDELGNAAGSSPPLPGHFLHENQVVFIADYLKGIHLDLGIVLPQIVHERLGLFAMGAAGSPEKEQGDFLLRRRIDCAAQAVAGESEYRADEQHPQITREVVARSHVV
jgi:hypothetical protein